MKDGGPELYVDLELELQFLRYAATVDFSVALGIDQDIFYGRAHRMIFGALLKLQSHFVPETLAGMVLKHVNAANYSFIKAALADVLDAPLPPARNAALAVLASLRDLMSQRTLTETALSVLDLAASGDVDDAFREIRSALDSDGSRRIESGDYIEDFPERKTMIENRSTESSDMIRTGLPEFDDATGGIRRGETAVIVARTGGGKSIAKLNFAVAAWLCGCNVVHVGLEMDRLENEFRADALLTQIASSQFRSASLKPAHVRIWEKTMKHYEKACGGWLEFVSGKSLSTEDIFGLLESVESRRGAAADMLVVDHVLLIQRPGRLDFHLKQWESFQALTEYARARNVVIWTSAQITDEGYNRKAGIRITDLKYSRAIGELAQIVLALYQTQAESVTGDHTLEVIKGRNIKTGTKYVLKPALDRMVLCMRSWSKLDRVKLFAGAYDDS